MDCDDDVCLSEETLVFDTTSSTLHVDVVVVGGVCVCVRVCVSADKCQQPASANVNHSMTAAVAARSPIADFANFSLALVLL